VKYVWQGRGMWLVWGGRGGEYILSPANLLVGEHELQLGNTTCGGHRRCTWRSTDSIKKNSWCHSHYRLIQLFNSFMRASSTENKVSCVLVSTALSLAVQSVLSLARTKAGKQLSPWTQPVLASRPFPLSNHKKAVFIWCMAENFRGCYCLQGVRAAKGTQLLAKSRRNSSGWKILSQTSQPP